MRIQTITAAALGAALALTVAPALAAQRPAHPGYEARAQVPGFDARAQAVGEGIASRFEAIRACNQQASRFANYAWGNNDSDHYRACMAQRGHLE